jgi:large conductance mechanosensitive channel
MLGEFRAFLVRGNVVDLAVAVVIGAAFGALVSSLVADIITPIVSLFGVSDFSTWTIQVGGLGGSTATFAVGSFLNALVSILLVSAAVFFVIVEPMNAMAARRAKRAEPESPAVPTEVEVLVKIRDELRRRPS